MVPLNLADLTAEEDGERLRLTIAEHQSTTHLTVAGVGLFAAYLLAWLEERATGAALTPSSWILDVPLRQLLLDGIGPVLRDAPQREETP